MEIIKYPKRSDWDVITRRPVQDMADIDEKVMPIMQAVREEGDRALIRYARLFDKADLENITVSDEEKVAADGQVTKNLRWLLIQP